MPQGERWREKVEVDGGGTRNLPLKWKLSRFVRQLEIWYNIRRVVMQLKCERIGRGTSKAFATPWEVCFNVAYPSVSLEGGLK